MRVWKRKKKRNKKTKKGMKGKKTKRKRRRTPHCRLVSRVAIGGDR